MHDFYSASPSLPLSTVDTVSTKNCISLHHKVPASRSSSTQCAFRGEHEQKKQILHSKPNPTNRLLNKDELPPFAATNDSCTRQEYKYLNLNATYI